MIFREKIAVFDLDGTLWNFNSHYEILNLFYKTKFWTSYFYRAVNKFVPSAGILFRDFFYRRIPDEFVSGVRLPFNEEIVALLEKKRSEEFYILIISNAPADVIISNAAARLSCDWMRSEIGEKFMTLRHKFDFRELFVCTDNVSDFDLVQNATSYCLIPRKSVKKFYQKRGFAV